MKQRYTPQTYQDRITDEAVEWFERIQYPAFNEADRAAFATWLQSSAEHVREYLQVAALWQDIEELDPEPDIDDLIKLAQSDQDQNILPLYDGPPEQSTLVSAQELQARKRNRLAGFGIAAAILLGISIFFVFNTETQPTIYQTGTGEQSSFPLPDGSIVTLNTQSEIRLRYSDTRRDIILTAGEVLFDVVRDKKRKFRVITNDVMIEAIGTRFNVRYRDADTTVTVVEGLIAVQQTGQVEDDTTEFQPVQVSAGQQVRVDADTVAITVINTDPAKATAWQLRRLVFESRPLASVIAEFNLYNDPPIIISDPELEQIPVSGAFNANDRASFVLFLEEMDLVQSHMQSNERILFSSRE